MKTQVTIKLNVTEDEDGRLAIFSRFRTEEAYQDGDTLQTAFTGEIENGGIENIYAIFNRGSGCFIGNDKYPYRSLSVGDVVIYDGVAHSVESVGFKVIDHPGVAQVYA